jgi:hypothetical protein
VTKLTYSTIEIKKNRRFLQSGLDADCKLGEAHFVPTFNKPSPDVLIASLPKHNSLTVIITPPFLYRSVCLHLHHQFFLLEAVLPFNKCLIICSPLLLPLSLLPAAYQLRPMARVLIMLQAGEEGRPGGSLPSSLMLATLS